MTDQELTAYSEEHLFHELQMFWWLARDIRTDDANQRNALVESFAIHLRNLIYFFYHDRCRRDDVIAADFFDNPDEWKRPEKSHQIKEALNRASKEVSHMTTERKDASDPTKPWELATLYSEIQPVAKDFANCASKTKLHEKVRELVNAPEDRITAFLRQHARSSNTVSSAATITFLPRAGHSERDE